MDVRRRHRARGLIVAALIAAGVLSGCEVRYEEEERTADAEYEVVERASEVPEAVEDLISRQGGSPYMLTFSDGETLYIARGYGADHLPGSTVTVEEVYETGHAVCVRTRIMGPDLREESVRAETAHEEPHEESEETGENPGILIRMRDAGKEVVFL